MSSTKTTTAAAAATTITTVITTHPNRSTRVPLTTTVPPTPPLPLRPNTDIHSCFNDPLYSDILLTLSDGREIHAHEHVLAPKSKSFGNLLANTRNPTSNKQTRLHLTFPEDDPGAMEALLRHFYGLSPTSGMLGKGGDVGLYFHLRLSVVAETHGCADLVGYATEAVRSYLERYWELPVVFPRLVKDVFELGVVVGRKLRKEVIRVCRGHLVELMARKWLREMLLSHGEVRVELVRAWAEEMRERRRRLESAGIVVVRSDDGGGRGLLLNALPARVENWNGLRQVATVVYKEHLVELMAREEFRGMVVRRAEVGLELVRLWAEEMGRRKKILRAVENRLTQVRVVDGGSKLWLCL
jgi:hypothetical protein